ncbi:MAG: hypothetical protein SGARI_007379, partial [Bacillariaceae sp.]
MKVSASAVLALSLLPSTGAFVSTAKKSASVSELNLHADKNAWVGPTATAVAGLTLVSQMAGATPVQAVDAATMIPPMITQGRNPSEPSIEIGMCRSSLQLAEKVDYLDFSLPSYSDNSASSGVKKDSSGAPSFSNPFSDFDPFASKEEETTTPAPTPAPAPAPVFVAPDTSAEDKAAADAAKKAEKEAAESAKKAEKAEKEAAKAKAQAAKETEKAAKKAEKEAAAQKKADADAEAAAKKAEKEA